MNIQYTEFNQRSDYPHFQSLEQFKAYFVLYWSLRNYQNLDINVTGGFAPYPAQPSVVVGQGTTLSAHFDLSYKELLELDNETDEPEFEVAS